MYAGSGRSRIRVCAGITLLVRVVLRSEDLPRLDEWKRVLTSPHALPARPTACEWLLERVIEPAAQGNAGADQAMTRQGSQDDAAPSADTGSVGSERRGNKWLYGVLMDCPSEPARQALCDILLCAVHTFCASARAGREDQELEHGPVGRLAQSLLNLFPAQASNPVNISTYLSLWAGLARGQAASQLAAPRGADSGGGAAAAGSTDASAAGLAGAAGRPSMCAWLLGRMRVSYLLAHLYLGTASPDANMPRIAALGGAAPELDTESLLQTIALVIQATDLTDHVLGDLTRPVVAKLALLGSSVGDPGDGVGLLVRMCSNLTLLRYAVQTLLAGMRNGASHYDAKEETVQSQRADAIQLLLASNGGGSEETRERVHVILSMLTDEASLQASGGDMIASPSSSPMSPSRMGVGAVGGDVAGHLVLLKRLSKMIVVASRLPRVLVWLQENRMRWVWMQKEIQEQHRATDQRSTSFVGLVRDLNEIAGYCDKTAVRVLGAGDELVNGAYRLVRHPVSGRVQYSRLVGDQEYTIWRDTCSASTRAGGAWAISCGPRTFYTHPGQQQGYFSSVLGRMTWPDRDVSNVDLGPPQEGWQVKEGLKGGKLVPALPSFTSLLHFPPLFSLFPISPARQPSLPCPSRAGMNIYAVSKSMSET